GDGERRVVIDLEPLEFGVVSKQHEIKARGWLIDPLPLAPDEVLWADWDGKQSSVLRTPVSELLHPTAGLEDFQEPGPDALSSGAKRWRRPESVGSKVRDRIIQIDPRYKIAELRDRVLQWISDAHGVPRAAITLASEEPVRIALMYRDEGASRWRELGRWSAIDPVPLPVGLAPDGRDLLVASAEGSDTMALRRFSVESRKLGEVIYARPGVDLTGVVFGYQSPEVIAVYWEEAGIRRYHYFDAFDAAQQDWLSDRHPGEAVHLTSRSADGRLFTILVSGPRNPGQYQLLDSAKHTTEDLGATMPWLRAPRLAPVAAIDVRAKDGKSIEAFLAEPGKFSGKRPPPGRDAPRRSDPRT